MAIAFVQQVGAGATTSAQTSFTTASHTYTAGNLLVAVVEWTYSGVGASVTITNPSGWTDSGIGTKNNGAPSGGLVVAVLPNNAGGAQTWTWNVTVNGGGTLLDWAWTIYEFSGAATSSVLDLTSASAATGASSSATWNSGAASGTTQSGDLLFGGVGLARSTTSTMTASASSVPTSGWSIGTWFDSTAATGANPKAHVNAQYQILSGAQASPSAVGTLSQNNSNEGILVTLKVAAAFAPPTGGVLPAVAPTLLPGQPEGPRYETQRTPYQGPGLVETLQTQTGISGGPPGNNTTEYDIWYTDPITGNGAAIGFIPAYGGDLTCSWWEIDAGVWSAVNQTSLTTTSADGVLHTLAQTPGAVFSGSEDCVFSTTWSEIAPTGQGFRKYFDTGTNTPSTGPALNWRVRVAYYPGDPFLMFVRLDVTNPSGSAVSLAGSDSLETALIGGLNQVTQNGINVWQPSNGFYATVGGTETAWPSALTTFDPDYVYCTPAAGAGISLTPFSVRKTGLAQAIGAGFTSVQVQYLQNANRLKMKLQGSFASFPASTTYTLYHVQGFRRNAAAGDVNSIAADLLNPESSSVVSTGTPASPFFSYDEGLYGIAASSNQAALTFALGSPATKKWLPAFKVTSYSGTSNPLVVLGGSTLTPNVDYIPYVDPVNQIAYVKFLKTIVASGAGTGQLNNGLLTIAAPSSQLAITASTASVSPASATTSASVAISAAAFSPSTTTATTAATAALTAPTSSPSVTSATLSAASAVSASTLSPSASAATVAAAAAVTAPTASPTATAVLLGATAALTTTTLSPSVASAITTTGTVLQITASTLSVSSCTATVGTSAAVTAPSASSSTTSAILSVSAAVSGATASPSVTAATVGASAAVSAGAASPSTTSASVAVAAAVAASTQSPSQSAATLATAAAISAATASPSQTTAVTGTGTILAITASTLSVSRSSATLLATAAVSAAAASPSVSAATVSVTAAVSAATSSPSATSAVTSPGNILSITASTQSVSVSTAQLTVLAAITAPASSPSVTQATVGTTANVSASTASVSPSSASLLVAAALAVATQSPSTATATLAVLIALTARTTSVSFASALAAILAATAAGNASGVPVLLQTAQGNPAESVTASGVPTLPA